MIARNDLEVGVLAAQIIHAAGESAALRPPDPGTHAVALLASPHALARLEATLADAGIAFAAIREPWAPWNGALMTIGIAPDRKSRLRRLVRNFRLI